MAELLSFGDVLTARDVTADDTDAMRVDPTPTCAATHLSILTGHELAELRAVALAYAVEEDAARGHVDSGGKGLRREEHLDQPTAEEHLHQLLDDWQLARVVHAHP